MQKSVQLSFFSTEMAFPEAHILAGQTVFIKKGCPEERIGMHCNLDYFVPLLPHHASKVSSGTLEHINVVLVEEQENHKGIRYEEKNTSVEESVWENQKFMS